MVGGDTMYSWYVSALNTNDGSSKAVTVKAANKPDAIKKGLEKIRSRCNNPYAYFRLENCKLKGV